MNDIHTQIVSPVLETDRMWLKALNPDVMDALFTAYPDSAIIDFLGIPAEALETEKSKFERGLTTHQISFYNFLLLEKETGEVLGKAGFHTWFQLHRRAEIGYAIHHEANMNRGYMREAMASIVAFGFREMNLNRIEACIGTANIPSQRLVQRLGFTQEGVLREHYCKNGIIEDSMIFSLLWREFNKADILG